MLKQSEHFIKYPIIRACYAAFVISACGLTSTRANAQQGSIPTDKPVSLSQAIQIARQNHGRIMTAEQALEASRQRVTQARTGTLPSVTAGVSYSLSGDRSLHTTPSGTSTFTSQSTNSALQPLISVNYNVYDGGLTKSRVRQALAQTVSSEAGLGTTRNDLAFQVAQSYTAQLFAQKTLTLRIEQEKLAEEQLKSVQAQIDVDKAAKADIALPMSEYRNRQVDRVQAENDLVISANTLRNTMGLPVGPALKLIEPEPSNDPLPLLETLRETAKRERPEIIDARARVEAAKADVSVARINRGPRVDTSASYSVTPNNDNRRQEWVLGASVSMPWFDAGLTQARIKEAEANQKSAEAQLAQIYKDVTAEVDQAYDLLASARARIDASTQAVDAAKVNLQASTERYNLGASGASVLTLITAQLQYSTASNNALKARYDLLVAQSQLDQALGKLK